MTVYNNEVRYRITVEDIRAGSGFTPYTNATFGITSGTWVLYNTDDILTKVDNPVQKINISKGGNFATGYSFGFEVTNFDFVKAILDDGVFFKNLKVTFEIELNSVWSTEWTGIIDTFTRVSELKANWKCTDAGKNSNEKIGSKEIPITLNRNYNCKLVEDESSKIEYVNRVYELLDYKDARVIFTDSNKNRISVDAYNNGEWQAEINNGTQLYIEVAMGGGAGSIFKVYNTELKASDAVKKEYWFYVNEDVSSVVSVSDINNGTKTSLSVVRLLSFYNTKYLSQKEVQKIHTLQNWSIEKALSVSENDITYPLSSPEDYKGILNSNSNQLIEINSINENNKIENFSLSKYSQSLTQLYVTSNAFAVFSDLSVDTLNGFDSISSKKQDIFLYLDSIVAYGFNDTPTSGTVNFTMVGYYKDIIASSQYVNIINTGTINLNPNDFSLSGTDLTVTTSNAINSDISSFELNNYLNSDSLSYMRLIVEVTHDSTSFTNPTGYDYNDFGIAYGGELNGKISIGCNGENVQPGNEYETVGNTIEYIQETYGNVDSADINDASYDQADTDFELFPSATERNPAHQITEQTDLNTLLKDLLYSHHLGLYFGRNGQYYLKNWLPESTVFFNSVTPVASFTEANFIDIGDIKRDNLNTIASDYELNYDYNEATGEYDKTIRIKNTSESSFDFTRDTEGVGLLNRKIAEEAWELLNAGYKRIRKESQTTHNNNWIKSFYSNGTGEGEALCFIRNQAGHINREHEYLSITIPYNSTNLGLELLSFISVRDLKVTSNVERLGWIVERKINTKKDYIELKLLLDISATDPFLVEIGVVQDDANEVGNEWTDDSTAIDEITDGDGK